MEGVIEMCGLLMIALHAKATFARPAARSRSKRVLVLAVEENGSKYSDLQTKAGPLKADSFQIQIHRVYLEFTYCGPYLALGFI